MNMDLIEKSSIIGMSFNFRNNSFSKNETTSYPVANEIEI